MHAWIGFFFSCAMIVVAALGKSGYQLLPQGIGGTPDTEFMFFLGCAGFSAALAMLAPSHSSARIASIWSASALGAVVVALNLGNFSGVGDTTREIEPQPAVQVSPPDTAQEQSTAKELPIKFELKRTVSEGNWAPFQDIDYRIRQMEREMPPQPENSEANPANIPGRE
jgi:hypothetical protein